MRRMYISNPSNGHLRRSAAESSASPAQCRMARALLRWTQQDLSSRAAVARKTIGDFESEARTLHVRTRLDITRAFEDAGVIFDEKGGARLAEPSLVDIGTPAATGQRLTQPLSHQRWGRRSGF